MAKNNDEIAANLYITTDYDKFIILKYNRGEKENNGVDLKKVRQLQRLIDLDLYEFEIPEVKVNKDFKVIDGVHTITLARANNIPLQYRIITSKRFNNISDEEFINRVMIINGINTKWPGGRIYKAALSFPLPLATKINEILIRYKNDFMWLDIMGLLRKKSDHFNGRVTGLDLNTFKDPKLIAYSKDDSFKSELKWFAKIHNKLKVAGRYKMSTIQNIYNILFFADDEKLDKVKFKYALLMQPANFYKTRFVGLNRRKTVELLIKVYNNKTDAGVKHELINKQISKGKAEQKPKQ